MGAVTPLRAVHAAAVPEDPTADDKRNALRGQMLSATNFYHGGRLTAADGKASSLMAIAGVGIGFLAQRAPLQTASAADLIGLALAHPSLVLLLLTIIVAALAQRAVRMSGRDWISHLVGGVDDRQVAEEFMDQSTSELLTMWIASQGLLVRIAQRKYRLINLATVFLLLGFSAAVLGI